jgi:hypothetical protein
VTLAAAPRWPGGMDPFDTTPPTVVTGEDVEALAFAGNPIPSTLRTHYRRAAKHGWAVAVVHWRQPARDPRTGAVRLVMREEPLNDPDTGQRLLTAKGAPRSTRVPIEPHRAVVEDTHLLQARISWEGCTQNLAMVWTDGKFDLALHSAPGLDRLKSTEVKAFLESGGTPPVRQGGVPLTLWAERAARRGSEDDDDDA